MDGSGLQRADPAGCHLVEEGTGLRESFDQLTSWAEVTNSNFMEFSTRRTFRTMMQMVYLLLI